MVLPTLLLRIFFSKECEFGLSLLIEIDRLSLLKVDLFSFPKKESIYLVFLNEMKDLPFCK